MPHWKGSSWTRLKYKEAKAQTRTKLLWSIQRWRVRELSCSSGKLVAAKNKIWIWQTIVLFDFELTFPNARTRQIKDVAKLESWEKTDQGLVMSSPYSLRTRQCNATWGIDSLRTSVKVTWCWYINTRLSSSGSRWRLIVALIDSFIWMKACFLKKNNQVLGYT